MKIIEFFGPPCSGKTFCSNLLIKMSNNFISSNKLILNHTDKILKLNFLDMTFKIYVIYKVSETVKNFNNKKLKRNVSKKKINNSLILKNKYSNFMINRYRKICKRLSNLYSKENSKFVNFYLNNIKKIKDKTIRKNYQLYGLRK